MSLTLTNEAGSADCVGAFGPAEFTSLDALSLTVVPVLLGETASSVATGCRSAVLHPASPRSRQFALGHSVGGKASAAALHTSSVL